MMNFQHIDFKQENKTALVTISRVQQLNALNSDTISELRIAIQHAGSNDQIRGVLLTGAGNKAFAAGADIKEFLNKTTSQAAALSKNGHELMRTVAELGKPVVALINGFALGGGLELALACHIRIASSEAKMGLPEVSLGLIPGYGGTQRLTQLVGKGKALEMMLTGEMIDAQDALKWGLVNHVVPPSDLREFAQSLLEKMYSRSPQAIAQVIAAINAGFDPGVNGMEAEIRSFSNCFGSADFQEGVSAFLEKRKADF